MMRFWALFCFIFTVIAFAQQPQVDPLDAEFEEIDSILENQFETQDQKLEKQFQQVRLAVERAYQGLTDKIEVQWGEDVELPTSNVWTTYTDDYETRVQFDFEQGVYRVETLVNKDIAKSVLAMQQMAKVIAMSDQQQLIENDVLLQEVKHQVSEVKRQGALPASLEVLPTTHIAVDEVLPTNTAELLNRIPDPQVLRAAIEQSAANPTTVPITKTPIVLSSEEPQQENAITKTPIVMSAAEPQQENAITKTPIATSAAEPQQENAITKTPIATSAAEPQQENAITKTPIVISSGAEPQLDAITPTDTQMASVKATQSTSNKPSVGSKVVSNIGDQSPQPRIDMPTHVSNEDAHSKLVLLDTQEMSLVMEQPKQHKKLVLTIPFINGYQKNLIENRLNKVYELSNQYDIEASLIMAVIETESSFNPMATSPIPAFGLMQLVPKTASVDAYQFLYGQKKVVSPSYLYDQDNNLTLGTVYLHMLFNRYLRNVKDPQNKLYCVVASYNTGLGNLAKTLTNSKQISKAVNKVNTMSPQQTLTFLMDHLPADETKRYLEKILSRKAKYQYLDDRNRA